MSEANLKKALRNIINAHMNTVPSTSLTNQYKTFRNVLKRRVASIVTPNMRSRHVIKTTSTQPNRGENLRGLTRNLIDAHLNDSQTRVNTISQKITDVIHRRLTRKRFILIKIIQRLDKIIEKMETHLKKTQSTTLTANNKNTLSQKHLIVELKLRTQKK